MANSVSSCVQRFKRLATCWVLNCLHFESSHILGFFLIHSPNLVSSEIPCPPSHVDLKTVLSTTYAPVCVKRVVKNGQGQNCKTSQRLKKRHFLKFFVPFNFYLWYGISQASKAAMFYAAAVSIRCIRRQTFFLNWCNSRFPAPLGKEWN